MAGGKTIGRLSIKVSPDLGGFSSEVKRKLKADDNEAEIPVIPDMKNFRRKLQAELKAANEDFEVQVTPVLSKTALSRLRKQFKDLGDIELQVAPKVDRAARARLEAELKRGDIEVDVTPSVKRVAETKARLERSLDGIEINPQLNTPHVRAERSRIERLLSNLKAKIELKLEGLKKVKHQLRSIDDREVTINADLDAGVARAKLIALTRSRWVKIRPVVDASSAAAARAALDALARGSGGHALQEWGRSIKDVLKNLDQIAPVAGVASASLLTLGLSVVSLTGHVTALVSGLVQMTPALLAVPGLVVGAGVAFGVLFRAMKGAKDALADLAESWTNLGDAIDAAFWERAAQPIRDLSNTVMPTLIDYLPRLSAGFGGWAAEMAGVLSSASGMAHVEEMLGNMVEATERATPGVRSLTAGLLALSSVGSRYMPRLADKFNEAALSFENWASGEEGANRIERAINKATSAASAMLSIFGSLGSVLASVGRAAGQSGYSLEDTAARLQRVADAMKSVTAQQIMVNVFSSARTAMNGFGAAMEGVAPTLESFSRNLRSVSGLAGNAAGSLARLGIEVLGDRNFGIGLLSFFEGVQRGASSLRNVSPEISAVAGAVLNLAGKFAELAGQNVAAIFENWGPIFTRVLDALTPLVDKLGNDLTEAIQKVTPYLEEFADKILIPLLEKLSDSDTNLVGVAGAVVAVVAAFKLLSGLASVLGIISSIATAVSGLAAAFGGGGAAAGGAAAAGGGLAGSAGAAGTAVTGFGASLGPIGAIVALVVAAVMALVAALVYVWNHSETFRNNVVELWENIKTSVGEAVQAVIAWWQEGMQPAFSELWTALQDLWNAVGVPIFDRITAVVETLSNYWGGAWEAMKTVISGVWAAISSIIQGAVSTITGIINVLVGMVTGDWSKMFQGLKQIASGAWTTITGIFRGGWNLVKGAMMAGVNSLKAIGSTLYTIGSNLIGSFIDGLKSRFAGVQNALSGLTKRIPNWKGPAERDKRLLVGPAKLIMAGFADALDKYSSIPENTLEDFTNRLASVSAEVQAGDVGDMEISGADVMIVNNYPKDREDSAVRDDVAKGIRLAAL